LSPASPPDDPDVRVVCVVYRPGEELGRFVATLREATRRRVELVVVDNGDDQTRSRPVSQAAGARLVVNTANLGYGHAANLGAAGARSPWLVVANPDVEWAPGSLDALIEVGEQRADAGALGPLIRDVDGSVYPSARELPSLRIGAGHAVLARVWPGNPWTRAYQARQERLGDQRDAGWLSGSCLLLRRAAFEQVGGFDDTYFMFFEDTDLGERLGRAGWANVYVPTAEITHIGGTSWRATPAPMIRAHHASARQYLHRRYHRGYQAPLRWAITTGLAVRERLEIRAAARAAVSPGRVP